MLKEAWTLAIETLSLIELQRLGERLALTRISKQLKIKDPRAIRLAHRLVSETLRKKNLIDHILTLVLEYRSMADLKSVVRSFLRLYIYEIKLSDGNLEKATKIVEMGRKIVGWWSLKDVEETLGRILSINISDSLYGLKETEKVAFQTYNPKWFVKYCLSFFGRDEALKFLEKSAEITPTYIRLNTLKAPETAILKNLQVEKISLKKEPQLKHTYRVINSKRPLPRTKSFHQGMFFIQDKASCLAAEIANPKEGTTVLDICAAPGSKTTYLAQLMDNKGEIISVDYSKRRIRIWKKETKRMGVKNAEPIVGDSRKKLPLKTSADLVILDPPCTSTGTFGKTPNAKWRLTKRSMNGLAKIQSEMIDHCAKYVKKGGFLVYSTCSISTEENEMVIEKFLKFHPEFNIAKSTPTIGLPGRRGLIKCQRLYPHIHECNGFFIAKLKKEKLS